MALRGQLRGHAKAGRLHAEVLARRARAGEPIPRYERG
jgi:hypothetical protein